MTSVNTNIAAMTALRTLQATNAGMEEVQNRVSTGLKIGSAKDNAAYWSIATTLQSDNKSLATVKDALGLGAATVDTAYEGLTQIKSVLDEIKSKLTLAQSQGVDRDTIQKEIADLQANIRSIAGSSSFSGENWLSVDSSTARFQATKQVVSSFSRDVSGSITIGTIEVDITKSALFDANTQATSRGILDSAVILKDKDGKQLAVGGVATTGNTNAAGLSNMNATGGKDNAATIDSLSLGTAASTNAVADNTALNTSRATFDTSVLELTGNAAVKTNDKLSFSISLDGANFINLETASIGGTGPIAAGADIAKAMETAIAGSAIGTGNIAVTFEDSGKLRFTVRRDIAVGATVNSAVLKEGALSSLSVKNILNTTGKAANGVLTGGGATTGSTTGANGTVGSHKAGANTAASSSGTAVQFGDTVTFTLNVDNAGPRVLTVLVGGGANGTGAGQAAILASINQAIGNNDDFRGKIEAVDDAGGTTGKIQFKSKSVGAGSSVNWTAFTNATDSARDSAIAASTTASDKVTGQNSGVSTFTTGTLNQTGSNQIKVGDKLTLAVTLDGSAVQITTDAIAGTVNPATGNPAPAGSTAASGRILAAMQAAIADSSLRGKIAVTEDPVTAGKYVFRSLTTNAAAAGLSVDITNATSNARDGGFERTAAFSGTGSQEPTTGYAVKTEKLSTAGLAGSDWVTIKYTVGGTAREAKVQLAAGGGDNASSLALATKLESATLAGAKLEKVQIGSTSDYYLKLSSHGAGAQGSVSLTDISVSDANGVKNVSIINGMTTSTAGNAKTAALNWAPMAATDKVRLSLSVDGTSRTPITVTAGANVTDFVANLNANTEFARYASAFKNGAGELVISSRTTGTDSKVSIDQIAFFGGDGVQQFKNGTGFFNTVSKVQAKSSDFSTFTLDKDDTLSFNVKLDGGAAKAVTINKALVDTTLGASANGKVATVEDYKAVLQAGLTAAGVTGLNVAVGRGVDASKLVFTNTDAKANSELFISDVVASAGGREISVDKIDISSAGLRTSGATDETKIRQVLTAYIDLVDAAIEKVKTAASGFGSVSSRIDTQSKFVTTLMDTIEKGVGNLIDADITEESTKLQALQVKQQLGVQSLSMANQGAQQILRLFQ